MGEQFRKNIQPGNVYVSERHFKESDIDLTSKYYKRNS